MTRHGRNCTAGAVYTYHEKQRDSKSSGWGSQKTRLSKDAIKDFDCCSLTLQPCKQPVVTKEGHLYDREAILEYILHEKQAAAKKMKAYEKQLLKDRQEKNKEKESFHKDLVTKFICTEERITTKRENPFVSTAQEDAGLIKKRKIDHHQDDTITNMNEKEKQNLPSFWIPTLTPHASESRVEKPDNKVYCPMSGKPIRMKDLTTVKFTLVPNASDASSGSKSLISKKERYLCPVTRDVLSNRVPCAVLRSTGDVVTMTCVDRFVKKNWTCPISGKKLTEKDVIELKRGGTGYSKVSGEELNGKVYGPSLMCG